MKWKDVYKKHDEINGKKTLCVYFTPRYKNKMPFSHKFRLKLAEKLITPFLLTKAEFENKQNQVLR